ESERLVAEANLLLQAGGNAELTALLGVRAMKNAYTFSSDVMLGQSLAQIYTQQRYVVDSTVNSVAFSPDGKQILMGTANGVAWLWDAGSGNRIRQFTGHSDAVTSVAFSPDDQFVLTGSADRSARLWNLQTGAEVRRFEGHNNGVTSVAFSSDGE